MLVAVVVEVKAHQVKVVAVMLLTAHYQEHLLVVRMEEIFHLDQQHHRQLIILAVAVEVIVH
jgi:hypothetical protein